MEIVNVPGANAAITAIASSGLPTHNFVFLGFPPKGKNAFRNILEKWSDFKGSLIFYQSKYKMPATYEILSEVYGNDRFIAVAREMTKIHETFIVGKIPEVEEKQAIKPERRVYRCDCSRRFCSLNLPPRKVAVVDIGSNSTKVLIALVNTNGEVVKVREEGFSCRLIDKGNISSAIISREKRKELLSGLSRLLKICTQEGVSDAILVARKQYEHH